METFEAFALLRDAAVRDASNGTQYVHGTIQTDDGERHTLKQWRTNKLPAEPGTVVEIDGRWTEYEGEDQVIANSITPTDKPASDYLEDPDTDPERYYQIIVEALEGVRENPSSMAGQVLHLLEREIERQKLLSVPAAKKHHHTERGGLVRHIASMVSLAKDVTEHYEDVDRELVLCGVVLHDLGKVGALTATGTKTSRGEREGHIAIALDWISRSLTGLDEDRESHLRHLVLSHHGRKEWGSPVEPKTPEAAVLHTLDLMDSRVDKLGG